MKNSETEGKEEGKLISSGSDLRQISDPVLTFAVGAGSTVVGRVSPKLKTGERRTNPQFYVKSTWSRVIFITTHHTVILVDMMIKINTIKPSAFIKSICTSSRCDQ